MQNEKKTDKQQNEGVSKPGLTGDTAAASAIVPAEMFEADLVPDSIRNLQAIDCHGHFNFPRSPKEKPPKNLHFEKFYLGDAKTVLARARRANTRLTIISYMLQHDPIGSNEIAARIIDSTDGLLQWVYVDPLEPKTYAQADEMLTRVKCVGIKIHPRESYLISEHGQTLFEFAAKHRAVVLTHSGHKGCMPQEFVPFANAFPEVKLIIAHLGNPIDGDPWHHVKAVQASRHGNVFVDTSSAKSITPRLIEWGVKEIGADRMLYGTDTPLYFAPMHRARIDCAFISDEEKKLILCDNARKLFNL